MSDGEPIWRRPSNQEWAETKAWTRQFMANRRELERIARREWIDGVRRRLGLVTEVHRCRVRKVRPWYWSWRCQRPDCTEAAVGCASQGEAIAEALAHARAFIPEPPEDAPVTELDVLAFDAFWALMRVRQDAFAAALPDRAAEVAGQLSALLPDGLRFEWVADGE